MAIAIITLITLTFFSLHEYLYQLSSKSPGLFELFPFYSYLQGLFAYLTVGGIAILIIMLQEYRRNGDHDKALATGIILGAIISLAISIRLYGP